MKQKTASIEHSYIGPRHVGALNLTTIDQAIIDDLPLLGIGLDEDVIAAMDAIISPSSTGNIPSPFQNLQTWLTGTVNIVTQARLADELVGITTSGNWEDQSIIKTVLEMTGKAMPYGDYTDVPLSSWNPNYEARDVVRFEEGLRVGKLEDARADRSNFNSAAVKRDAAAEALAIARNGVAFSGYNVGTNRTYGLLNDPSLPSYTTVAAGASTSTLWSTKTFLEITADLRIALSKLRTQSGSLIDPFKTPITLGVAAAAVEFLTVTSTTGDNSVWVWLKENYPNVRVVAIPEFNAANGGANVFYLYADSMPNSGTDGGRVFEQIVPVSFKILGVEQRIKAYLESYTMATAGIFLNRPWAIVRYSGI